MIKLCTRKEITDNKKVISSVLTEMQQVFYEDDLYPHEDENEAKDYKNQFDVLNNEIIDYETYDKVIGLEITHIDTYTAELSNKLTTLFSKINAKEFIIISHLKVDFFGNRDDNDERLVNSYKKLEQIVGQKTYKEAFICDLKSLPDFIEILIWKTRGDTSAPEFIYIFDKDETVQVNICSEGNIHLEEFGNENLTDETLKSLGWKVFDGYGCEDLIAVE